MRNIHLQHFEDLIFFNDYLTIREIIRRLVSNKKDILIQRKIDGSPSILFGPNPENGRFFVGLKSTFNITPKVFYSQEEIEQSGYREEIKKILQRILVNAKDSSITNIVQGDFLFLKEDLCKKVINGKEMYLFTPNVITYATGEINEEVEMGLVLHTSYSGSKLSNLHVVNKPIDCKLRNCWSFDLSVNSSNFNTKITSFLMNGFIETYHKSIDSEFMNSLDPYLFLNFYNYLVRNESNREEILESFYQYIEYIYTLKINSLVRKSSISEWTEKKNHDLEFYGKNKHNLSQLFSLHEILILMKKEILKSVGDNDLLTFFNRNDKLIPTTHEGLVINIEGYENGHSFTKLVKMVDRDIFSVQNFKVSRYA